MALKKREKILAAATGGLVLAGVVIVVLSMTGGETALSTGELRRQREAKSTDLRKKQAVVAAAAPNVKKMAEWEKRSLPAQPEAARSSYQKWLRELVEELRFRDSDIYSGEGQPRKNVYTIFPFRVEGRASLEQVTRFLHAFYSAPHLHQIRRLTLVPLENSKEFTVTMAIEAASLPTADRPDKLADGQAQRLAHQKLDEYLKTIVHRCMEGDRIVDASGVFTVYSPPPPPVVRRDPPRPPPPPPKPPGFDHTPFTVVTGITEVDSKLQVWLEVKTTGKTYRLVEGDTFEVGEARGAVRRIRPREAEIELKGELRRVTVGGNLRDATVVQSSAAKAGSS